MTLQIYMFFCRFHFCNNLQTDLLNVIIIFEPAYIFTGKFSLGSGRKKERMRIRSIPDIFARGALVWNVQASNTFVSENQIKSNYRQKKMKVIDKITENYFTFLK